MDVRRSSLAATAVLGVGLLAACGSGTGATTASSSPAAARGNGGGNGGFGASTGQPPGAFGLVIRGVLIQILVTITLVMAIIAGVDLIWQRIHWRQDLRMTRQEVRDELKQSDGDPLVKARIRSVARDRARRRAMCRPWCRNIFARM